MKRRNTHIQQAILTLLKSTGSALSQDMVAKQMESEADRVTVYRVLNRFCEDGILHRITSDDGKYYFALCKNCNEHKHVHNHYHFRCLNCQKIECLKEEITVNLPAGYQMQNFNAWVSGYCNTCNMSKQNH